MTTARLLGLLAGGILLSWPVAGQDPPDVAKLVDRLGSESLTERDEAARQLEQLPTDRADELAKWPATDPEIRSRLTAIAETLRARARLTAVFGPTRRVTISAENRPLAEVAAEIGKALGEEISIEDPRAPQKVSVKLANATLWQALDALSEFAGVRYRYESDRVGLKVGRGPALPAKHLEQFRVGVVQATRTEAWTPHGVHRSGMVGVSVRYQRNLQPVRGWFGEGIRISSVVDAKGNEVNWEDRPPWAGTLMVGGHGPFEILEQIQIPGTAAPPLAVAGEVNLRFALEHREIELPIEGKGKPHREAGCEFEIQQFSNTDAGFEVAVHVKVDSASEEAEEGEEGLKQHLQVESVVVKRRDGSTQAVRYTGGSSSLFEFQLEEKVKDPVSVRFRWTTKFHQVRFDWRLEGVKLPD